MQSAMAIRAKDFRTFRNKVIAELPDAHRVGSGTASGKSKTAIPFQPTLGRRIASFYRVWCPRRTVPGRSKNWSVFLLECAGWRDQAKSRLFNISAGLGLTRSGRAAIQFWTVILILGLRRGKLALLQVVTS
jgi:hypothetical protein